MKLLPVCFKLPSPIIIMIMNMILREENINNMNINDKWSIT